MEKRNQQEVAQHATCRQRHHVRDAQANARGMFYIMAASWIIRGPAEGSGISDLELRKASRPRASLLHRSMVRAAAKGPVARNQKLQTLRPHSRSDTQLRRKSRYNTSIDSKSRKALKAGEAVFNALKWLHSLQLILHSTTVPGKTSMSPGCDGSVLKDCRKCASGRLDLLPLSSDHLALDQADRHSQGVPRPRRIHR